MRTNAFANILKNRLVDIYFKLNNIYTHKKKKALYSQLIEEAASD